MNIVKKTILVLLLLISVLYFFQALVDRKKMIEEWSIMSGVVIDIKYFEYGCKFSTSSYGNQESYFDGCKTIRALVEFAKPDWTKWYEWFNAGSCRHDYCDQKVNIWDTVSNFLYNKKTGTIYLNNTMWIWAVPVWLLFVILLILLILIWPLKERSYRKII